MSKLPLVALSIILLIISCDNTTENKEPIRIHLTPNSNYNVTSVFYTKLERLTRDGRIAMNMVSKINWSVFLHETIENSTSGSIKINSIRSSMEIFSPSQRTYEINTSDTSSSLFSVNSKPYTLLQNQEFEFKIRNNVPRFSDSTYFKLCEELPSAHREDLVSEQFFLLLRDQAFESYLDHILVWPVTDTTLGTAIGVKKLMFQGLTLELNDTVEVKQKISNELKLNGAGKLTAWHGLHGVDGILSKKNRANGINDIEVLFDLTNGIPKYVNIHLSANGKARNYETMYPFNLEADVKHTVSRMK